MTALKVYKSNDGIELVIDASGEVFYPGYRSLARVCSIGLEKPIHQEIVKRTIESTLKGVTDSGVQTAEVLTEGGLQGVTLIPRKLGTPALKKYNSALYETMADVVI